MKKVPQKHYLENLKKDAIIEWLNKNIQFLKLHSPYLKQF